VVGTVAELSLCPVSKIETIPTAEDDQKVHLDLNSTDDRLNFAHSKARLERISRRALADLDQYIFRFQKLEQSNLDVGTRTSLIVAGF
jgi:hypothetical protein